MDKLTNLKLLKTQLDGILRVDWDNYLKLQDLVSFQRYKKRRIIRTSGVTERNCYLVMEGLVGMNINEGLVKVFPQKHLVMDRANRALERSSPYALEALEETLVVFMDTDSEQKMLESIPAFGPLSKALYNQFDELDRFFESIKSLPLEQAVPRFRETLEGLEKRLPKRRFAQLLGKSPKTISRFEEKFNNGKMDWPFLKKLGVAPSIHPNSRMIRHKVRSWVDYYPLLADPDGVKKMQQLNLPFLIVRAFPMGKEDRVEWAGKLMALLTAIDLFMYHFHYGEGPFYWEKVKRGFHNILEGRGNSSNVPRLNAYFSALKDLMELAGSWMTDKELEMVVVILKSYLKEREWRAGSHMAKDKSDMLDYRAYRAKFSEGRLGMACLKIVHRELWESIHKYRKDLETFMELAISLIIISNEMMVGKTKVFGDLPHNYVNLEVRLGKVFMDAVLEGLRDSFEKVHDQMEQCKKENFGNIEGPAKQEVAEFLRLVEQQVMAWPEWYGKVLSKKTTN
ncbi:cyclic nucleotide-binding domain-containing protein [Echinicola rosea]|uniref:Cyclic nucleotide-binding domain-containing protein n=1 Tax=Echinicola rosea TaxID=1807691 RepID=A0ABQ1V7P6_9BACT|nr:hypothetical protein [Echinicola rosea]GGF42584.1 hypothetical protein GCM10011339_33830 [Echinicola rosea]